MILSPAQVRELTDARRSDAQARELPSLAEIAKKRKPIDLESIPDECGVYFLFCVDALQYVGKATYIARRIAQHLYPYRPALKQADWFDSWSALLVPEYSKNRVEQHYIVLLRPPRNRFIPGVRQR